MAKRDSASALKALAKRPNLVSAIEKGNKKIKQLRETVEKTGVTSSGGFIRSLVWAGICSLDDNKFVKFVKTFKKSQLEDFSKPVKSTGKKVVEKEAKTKKELPVKKEKAKNKPVEKVTTKKGKQEKPESKPKTKEPKTAEEPKQPKAPKVEKSGLVKLLRPIGDIPANHPVLAEYYNGFWHIKGKHIAVGNIQFIETKHKEEKKTKK